MKVALCVCGRNENRYAVEFVDYYKQLGFNHIYIADNNVDDGEHFEDVLQTYIDNHFVSIIDYRNAVNFQVDYYNDIYNKIQDKYEWIAFFDFDEFLVLEKNKTIQDYLSRECFKDYEQILINWKIYTDNDLVYDDGRSCIERFTTPMEIYKCTKYKYYPENKHVKKILRSGLSNFINFVHNGYGNIKTCNNKGIEINGSFPLQKINYDYAYIKHFMTKTIDEFIKTKYYRNLADSDPSYTMSNTYNCHIGWFFKINNITDSKIQYLIDHNINTDEINKEFINNWWTDDRNNIEDFN